MKTKNTIKDWAKDDRPREKLIARGPQSLSNSELLAILIHNGTPQKTALDLAKEVLELGSNHLSDLGKLTLSELMHVKGIGEAKAVTLSAALELGRRRQTDKPTRQQMAAGSKHIGEYLQAKLKDYLHEVFAAVYLNQNNNFVHYEVISAGGITGTVADPRIILKKALEKNAVGIILAHNHPSGNLLPSRADELLTNKIKEGAKLLDIKVMDHIIVSDTGYYSFADEGLL